MAPPPSSDSLDRKRVLRRQMAERRRALPADERRARDEAACARLLALPELGDVGGRVVAGYVALNGEIDPAGVLREVAARGGVVALPRVTAHAPRLRFHAVAPGAALVRGRFDLLEPDAALPDLAVADLDVVVVPGTAFDGDGRRLGLGGGYYDEALAAARVGGRAVAIGFGYDFQLVDGCPADDGDQPVDVVVTDARVVRRAGAGAGGG